MLQLPFSDLHEEVLDQSFGRQPPKRKDEPTSLNHPNLPTIPIPPKQRVHVHQHKAVHVLSVGLAVQASVPFIQITLSHVRLSYN